METMSALFIKLKLKPEELMQKNYSKISHSIFFKSQIFMQIWLHMDKTKA